MSHRHSPATRKMFRVGTLMVTAHLQDFQRKKQILSSLGLRANGNHRVLMTQRMKTKRAHHIPTESLTRNRLVQLQYSHEQGDWQTIDAVPGRRQSLPRGSRPFVQFTSIGSTL
jgi:hypothetical protein